MCASHYLQTFGTHHHKMDSQCTEFWLVLLRTTHFPSFILTTYFTKRNQAHCNDDILNRHRRRDLDDRSRNLSLRRRLCNNCVRWLPYGLPKRHALILRLFSPHYDAQICEHSHHLCWRHSSGLVRRPTHQLEGAKIWHLPLCLHPNYRRSTPGLGTAYRHVHHWTLVYWCWKWTCAECSEHVRCRNCSIESSCLRFGTLFHLLGGWLTARRRGLLWCKYSSLNLG